MEDISSIYEFLVAVLALKSIPRALATSYQMMPSPSKTSPIIVVSFDVLRLQTILCSVN